MGKLTESDIEFLQKWSGILEEAKDKSYIHIYPTGKGTWTVTTSVHKEKRAGGQELKSGFESVESAKKFVNDMKSRENSSYKNDEVVVTK
jgi:hypothetical protein